MTKCFLSDVLKSVEVQEKLKLEQKIANAKHVKVDDSKNESENEGIKETEGVQ